MVLTKPSVTFLVKLAILLATAWGICVALFSAEQTKELDKKIYQKVKN